MKIINPSATIIEKELAGLSVCQRIDRCGRRLLPAKPKPTEEGGEAFCRYLIRAGAGHLCRRWNLRPFMAMPFWDSLDYREKIPHTFTTIDSPWVSSGPPIRAFGWKGRLQGHVSGNFLPRQRIPVIFRGQRK